MNAIKNHPAYAVAILLAAIMCAASGCASFQSETTVFGIEITCIDSATMMPTGRAGLIRHKNQLTQAGQSQKFYNAETNVNLWKGCLGWGCTQMSAQTEAAKPDSACGNEAEK